MNPEIILWLVAAALSFIEIPKVKLNMWGLIGSAIKKGMLGETNSKLDKIIEKQESDDQTMRMLLLGTLKSQAQSYLAEKKISSVNLQSWIETFEEYKRRGGDGYADALKVKIMELPLED